MIVIACIDDRFGLMFNKRRQSSDRKVIERIIELTTGNRLYMNAYSYKLFSEYGLSNVVVEESFMSLASRGDFCFVEGMNVIPYKDKIEKIIIFKWNRRYPGDTYFDVMQDTALWQLMSSSEFVGKSHEKITEEVYAHA